MQLLQITSPRKLQELETRLLEAESLRIDRAEAADKFRQLEIRLIDAEGRELRLRNDMQQLHNEYQQTSYQLLECQVLSCPGCCLTLCLQLCCCLLSCCLLLCFTDLLNLCTILCISLVLQVIACQIELNLSAVC